MCNCPFCVNLVFEGAQWLSGRVLDSRSRGCGFEPYRRHCVVVLEQDTFNPSLVLVKSRRTSQCLTEGLLMGCKESNKTNNKLVSDASFKSLPCAYDIECLFDIL